MLEVNSSLIIQLINFLILLIVLNFLLYRPIRKILNQRKNEVSSSISMTGDWNLKAGSYSTELQENMNKTRMEGLKEKDLLKQKGLEEEKKMLQETHESIEEKINRNKQEIQEKLEQARLVLQKDVDGFSRDLAEKILGRGL